MPIEIPTPPETGANTHSEPRRVAVGGFGILATFAGMVGSFGTCIGGFQTAVNWKRLSEGSFISSFPIAGTLLLTLAVATLALLFVKKELVIYLSIASVLILSITYYNNRSHRAEAYSSTEIRSSDLISSSAEDKLLVELKRLNRRRLESLSENEQYGGWMWLPAGTLLMLIAGVLNNPALIRKIGRSLALFEQPSR